MFKYLNRGVSSALAIGIIAVLAIVVGGAVLAYQYYYIPKEESKNPVAETPKTEVPKNKETDSLSKLDKDELLHKLFPNLTFKDGVAGLEGKIDYPGLSLYLKNSKEDYFITPQEKNLLLTVNLDGVPHVGGMYHAFLGLFDKNGDLLTPSSLFPKLDPYDFNEDKAQFGGDAGFFGFYNCHGIKYIAFISRGCPNSTCCSDGAALYKISNGNFEIIQTINQNSLLSVKKSDFSIIPSVNAALGSGYALRMTLTEDKIIIKKIPELAGYSATDSCPETDYKVLNWNIDSCRSE